LDDVSDYTLNREARPPHLCAGGRAGGQHGGKSVCALSATPYAWRVTAEMFKSEMADALKAYDRYIICIHKTPDEFQAAVLSLINKAIRAYEDRGTHMRHGIALDKYVTVILSQTDGVKPLCGIYFNLHSPYQKPLAAKAAETAKEEKRRATRD
jgi:hypothetical protein